MNRSRQSGSLFSAGLSALAILLATPADAAPEPYGFKGVNLGSHIRLIAENPKYDCRAVITPTADHICTLRKHDSETLAGRPVGSLFYFYDQAALTGIAIGLDEQHFQPAMQALGEKYGPPACRSEAIRNLNQQSFQNQTCTWHRSGQSIVAERYSGRLDKSTIRISDDTAATKIKQRREQMAKHPQRDL